MINSPLDDDLYYVRTYYQKGVAGVKSPFGFVEPHRSAYAMEVLSAYYRGTPVEDLARIEDVSVDVMRHNLKNYLEDIGWNKGVGAAGKVQYEARRSTRVSLHCEASYERDVLKAEFFVTDERLIIHKHTVETLDDLGAAPSVLRLAIQSVVVRRTKKAVDMLQARAEKDTSVVTEVLEQGMRVWHKDALRFDLYGKIAMDIKGICKEAHRLWPELSSGVLQEPLQISQRVIEGRH